MNLTNNKNDKNHVVRASHDLLIVLKAIERFVKMDDTVGSGNLLKIICMTGAQKVLFLFKETNMYLP